MDSNSCTVHVQLPYDGDAALQLGLAQRGGARHLPQPQQPHQNVLSAPPSLTWSWQCVPTPKQSRPPQQCNSQAVTTTSTMQTQASSPRKKLRMRQLPLSR